MKTLSLDQSTNITGWSIFKDGKLKGCGYYLAQGKHSIEKINDTENFLIDMIKTHNPDMIIIEDIQYQNNIHTFKVLAELLGVLENSLYKNEIAYIIIPSTQWKSLCGIKGRKRDEQKQNAIKFVREKFNIDVSSDVADAICLNYYAWQKVIRK